MSKARSGGGITSNRNVRPAMRNPTQSKAVSPGGASQLGLAMGALKGHGNAAERLFQGRAPQSTLGNELAKNVGGGGPGTGRTVHRAGSQMQYGPSAGTPPAKGRDILSGFGPEIGGGKR
jgi:hypothetical protein